MSKRSSSRSASPKVLMPPQLQRGARRPHGNAEHKTQMINRVAAAMRLQHSVVAKWPKAKLVEHYQRLQGATA